MAAHHGLIGERRGVANRGAKLLVARRKGGQKWTQWEVAYSVRPDVMNKTKSGNFVDQNHFSYSTVYAKYAVHCRAPCVHWLANHTSSSATSIPTTARLLSFKKERHGRGTYLRHDRSGTNIREQ